MIFHGFFRSSSAHRCRIAFNLKGIEPDLKFVHLRRQGGEQKLPEYLAINPQGLVPSIETPEGLLTQSLAIIEWLDELQPSPPLLPNDPMIRARVRAFSQAIACDIHPLQNLRVLLELKAMFGADQALLDAWCRHWNVAGLSACEELCMESSAFCFGDQPTMADVCLVPQIFSAQRFGVDIAAFPRLQAIFDRCMKLSAFANASPSAQPDAE